MKKGDLVNFYSTVASFQKDYADRNPGLVVASREPPTKGSYAKASAYVLWSNGEMTREYHTYLELAE